MQLRNSLCALALAASAVAQQAVSTVYQFQNSFSGVGYVNLENIAVRSSNGQLVVNMVTGAIMAQVDPLAANPQAQLLVNISNAYPGAPGSLTGIVETKPDVFAVAAGNFVFGPQVPGGVNGIPGSFSIWTVDLTGDKAEAKKVVDIPEAGLLDGMAKPYGYGSWGCQDVVLVVDSAYGAIYRVDIAAGSYEKVLYNDLFLPNKPPNPMVNFGINGIKFGGPMLYFTNSAQGIFGGIPFGPNGYPYNNAQPQIFANATNGTYFDDFALGKDDNAYIATHANSIYEVVHDNPNPILLAGSPVDLTYIGGSPFVGAPTATVFGPDGRLYITTAGVGGGPMGPMSGGIYAISV